MRIAVFSSHGPGNFQAAIAAARSNPDLMEVSLLVSDRLGIPSTAVATQEGIHIISRDFNCQLDGLTATDRRTKSDMLHVDILSAIRRFEDQTFPIDICVLAYRRIIRGPLLDYFRNRMINQHPADLGVFDVESRSRRYKGIGGLQMSITDGVRSTRTSTILINDEVDAGEILVQGPSVAVDYTLPFDVDAHEMKQKKISDWPALKTALLLIASGRFAIATNTWPDGCRIILLDNTPLQYCGIQIDTP